jgi:hypothetical protein
MGVSRDDYVVWVLSTHAILLLAVWQFNARFASTDPIHRGRTSLLFIILALAITGLSASTLIYLPDAWGTSILTGVSILIIASLVWQAIKIALDEEYRPTIGLLIVILLTIIGISLPIQDLPLRAQMSGVAGVSTLALGTIRPLIPLALLAGLSATLAKKFDKPIGKPLKPIERDLGRVILVAFAVGFSPSWGFIPISVFISLVFFEWILPEKKFASTRAVEQFAKEHQKQAVSALLDLNRELRLWNSAEVDLQKQIKAGKIKIQEYEAQSKEHEDKSRELTRPEFLEGFEETTSVRNLAFNFGAGPRHKDNLRLAIVWGSIFLIPLTLVQGWPLVTAEVQNSLPFPFIHIASRLGVFIGQFLAMAVFLGHFFPYLRGRNGLEKGGWLAGTIVFSLLPAQLIIADSTIDLMALIFWAGTILAYTLLIGLLAFDLRTLSELGLRWNRLTDLYNFRELTFYLTGSGAPLFTTIFSVIAGSLNDLVPAILKVVFPTVTLSGAQNELLRVLLELASQIGTEVLK